METAAREIVLPTPSGVLSGLVWGADPSDASARRVLCVHGWLDNAASFSFLGPYLAESLSGMAPHARSSHTPVCVVALDLLGHGRSCRLAGGLYSSGGFAVATAEALFSMGWASVGPFTPLAPPLHKFAIVGHGLGGGIALLVAGALPHTIGAIALLDSAGPPIRNAHDAPDALASTLLARSLLETVRASTPSASATSSEAEAVSVRIATTAGCPKSLSGAPQTLSEAAARALVRRALKPAVDGTETSVTSGGEDDGDSGSLPPPVPLWTHDIRVKFPSASPLGEAEVLAFCERISAARIPVFVANAEHGWPYDVDVFRVRMNTLSSAAVQVDSCFLQGSHHFHLDVDSAQYVGHAVADFLAKHIAAMTVFAGDAK